MAESLRTSSRRSQNASSVAPAPWSATKTGKRGTKRGADGAPLAPAATVDEDGIKQSLGFVWKDAGSVKEEQKDVDVSDGAPARLGVLGKKDKQRLLAVLTALSLPPNESNIQDDASAAAFANAKKRARFMQLILDQAFLAPTEDGQMDSKMSTETTQVVPGVVTLRSMLTRDDTWKTDDVLSHINALSIALVPDVPEPFPSASMTGKQNAATAAAAPTPNTRIPGSRAKPIKDAVLIDTLSTVRDVIDTVLSPHQDGTIAHGRTDEEEEGQHDAPKHEILQWALHQRLVPPQTPGGAVKGKTAIQALAGDWFSGIAEVRDVVPASTDVDDESKIKEDGKEEEDESVMIRMERAGAFGNADVVILPRSNDVRPTSTASAVKSEPAPPKLKDILFVHPSRAKAAHQWEDRRRPKPAQKRLVQYPRYATSFTPSFAPTHDSSAVANEWGYFSTWDAACMRAGLGRWRGARWGKKFQAAWEEAEKTLEQDNGYDQEVEQVQLLDRPRATKRDIAELLGSLLPSSSSEEDHTTQGEDSDDLVMEIDPALVDAVDEVQEDMRTVQAKLDQNAAWVRQLQAFQEVRVRTGQRMPLEEEECVAQKLQQSLVELASATTPSALLPRAVITESEVTSVPLAITLARKAIHISAPNVRGTLDPARPKAMVDNTTAVAKPPGQIAPAPTPIPTNARASPGPAMSARTPAPRGGWAGPAPVPQRVPSGNGPIPQSPAGMYSAPPQAARQTSRYTFPPQSNPAAMHSPYPTNPAAIGGRSSPIAPMNSVPSVLRNALPQPVGVGSFSPMGRSTLAPTSANPPTMPAMSPAGAGMMAGNSVNAMYAGGGQQGRGIGSSMGISMNSPGTVGGVVGPAPAFRPSNSMRGSG